MLSDENLTANTFKNVQAIQGETVKGIISIPRSENEFDWIIVFESGYGLHIHWATGAYWINNKKKTKELLEGELSRRKGLIEDSKHVEELLK